MRRTKKEKYGDLFDAFKCVQEGKPVKRSGAKDGSIPTHPVVPCLDVSEKIVQDECITWLKARRVFGTRSNVGAGQLVSTDKAGFSRPASGFQRYGIKDAGDWLGLMSNGIHLEIEFKRGKGGRLSKGQQKRMDNIRRNNGLFFVIHGVPELEYYVGTIMKEQGFI